MNRIFLLLLASVALPAATLFAQKNNLEFERISVRNGFSQFSVYSILQDRDGFLWFGSLDGLGRFDGHQFKVYKSNAADSTSLSDDWILALHEDAEGTLWIGTAAGGLNSFDRQSGRFRHFPLVDYVVASQAEDIPIIEAPVPYSLLVNKSITKIHEEPNGVLWIGTWGGRILKFDKKSRQFLKYAHPGAAETADYNSPITEIYRDRQGVLWIGTFGSGLFRHGVAKKQATDSLAMSDFFKHFRHQPGQPNSLPNDRVTKILEVSHSHLLVATFGGGLAVLDRTSDSFSNYSNDANDTRSISGDKLVSLFAHSTPDIKAAPSLPETPEFQMYFEQVQREAERAS